MTTVRPRHTLLTLWIVIALACACVVSLYSQFGFTWDEPEHLAAGMALVEKGTYPYDMQHPPIARIAMSIGPYLAGARGYGTTGPSGEHEGRLIFYKNGQYDTYLTAARIGMLPFFVLLLFTTWAWARRFFGATEAAIALLIVSTLPPIVGHAAVAALDIPMAATTLLALYLLARWFDQPSIKHAAYFGLALGLAVATKLSAIPFIACVALAWIAVAFVTRKAADSTAANSQNSSQSAFDLRSVWQGLLALLIASIVIILSYGIGLEPLSKTSSLKVPQGIPRFIISLQALFEHNTGGHLSYFMGELHRTGWWNFYLVGLAVKTPIPTLIMGMAGLGWLAFCAWRERAWLIAAPSIAFIVILLFASSYSQINIGIRHILVLYPLMAIGAAALSVYLWRSLKPIAAKSALIGLCLWQLFDFAYNHPHHLAYFNVFAGKHPERILVDSDLDWGQDIHHLGDALRERGIDKLSIAFRGTADLDFENLPPYTRLWGNQNVKGWVAVNLLAKLTDEHRDLAWLDQYTPVARIGRSVDLYYVE